MVKPLLESLTFDQAKMQILHEGEGEKKDEDKSAEGGENQPENKGAAGSE